MDDITFAKGMKLITTTFRLNYTPEQSAAVFMLLGKMDNELFLKAVTKLCTTKTELYPNDNVAALLIQSTTNGLSATDNALMAWEKAIGAVRNHGGYASVQFDDPIIHSTIRAISPDGTWAGWCGAITDHDLPFKRKEFIETYQAIAKDDTRRHPEYLVGSHEGTNRLNKHDEHIAAPVLIGDKQKMIGGKK